MTGADLLALTLQQRNVEFVSTLSGNGLNPLYVACDDAGIRLIDTRNEQAAAYIADAYARLTARVGVCAVSSGVAVVNAMTGLTNAWFDGAPVLLITGESPSARNHMGKFQELDAVELTRPVTKYSRRVLQPEKVAFYVREALAHATSGRPGPAHLSIPVDVLEAEVPEGEYIRVAPGPGEVRQDAAADTDLVAEAARLIAAAERPVLIAGTGCFYAEAQDELAEFADLAGVPVMVPIWDRGVVQTASEWFMGVVGAASGSPPILQDADLVLLVGARTDYRIGYGLPPTVSDEATLVRIDVDAAELRSGIEPNHKLLGDPCTVLGQLAAATRRLEAGPHTEWLTEAQGRRDAFLKPWVADEAPEAPPLTGRHIVDAVRPFLDDDTVFLIDGGNIGQWAHLALADRYPSHWLTCGASAVVGWGLPGAVAARLAYPDRPILLLSGDGAIGFTLGEFETSVKHSAPFVALVADDQAWGIVVSGQRQAYGDDGVLASRTAPVRYAQIADACGARGVRADDPLRLDAALKQAFADEGTTLIHAPIALGGPADGTG